MKCKIFLFVIFGFFLLFSSFQCNRKLDFNDLKPPKLLVDSTVPKQELQLVEKFMLQENDETILSDISDLQFSLDSMKILIIDPTSRNAMLYDYSNGKLLNSIHSGMEFTKLLEFDTATIYRQMPKMISHMVKYEDYTKYLNKENLKRFLSNTFYKACFSEDGIYLLTLIYYLEVTPDNKKVGGNRTIIIKLDDNFNIQYPINLQLITSESDFSNMVPYPRDFIYHNENKVFWVSALDEIKSLNDNDFDSIMIYGEFDEMGKFKRTICYQPKKYSKHKYNPNFYRNYYLRKIGDGYFLATVYDLAIYNFNDELLKPKLFDLYNLPFSNDTGFVYYNKIIEKLNERNENTIEKRSELRFKLFPVLISNVLGCNGNILVYIKVLDSLQTLGYYTILQEYTTNGKLVSQTNLYDSEYNQIKWIAFDNKNNYLVLIRRTKSGWYLEKRKWEKFN